MALNTLLVFILLFKSRSAQLGGRGGIQYEFQYNNLIDSSIYNDVSKWLYLWSNNCSFVIHDLKITQFYCNNHDYIGIPVNTMNHTSSYMRQIYYNSNDNNSEILSSSSNINVIYLFNDQPKNAKHMELFDKRKYPFTNTKYNVLHVFGIITNEYWYYKRYGVDKYYSILPHNLKSNCVLKRWYMYARYSYKFYEWNSNGSIEYFSYFGETNETMNVYFDEIALNEKSNGNIKSFSFLHGLNYYRWDYESDKGGNYYSNSYISSCIDEGQYKLISNYRFSNAVNGSTVTLYRDMYYKDFGYHFCLNKWRGSPFSDDNIRISDTIDFENNSNYETNSIANWKDTVKTKKPSVSFISDNYETILKYSEPFVDLSGPLRLICSRFKPFQKKTLIKRYKRFRKLIKRLI